MIMQPNYTHVKKPAKNEVVLCSFYSKELLGRIYTSLGCAVLNRQTCGLKLNCSALVPWTVKSVQQMAAAFLWKVLVGLNSASLFVPLSYDHMLWHILLLIVAQVQNKKRTLFLNKPLGILKKAPLKGKWARTSVIFKMMVAQRHWQM